MIFKNLSNTRLQLKFKRYLHAYFDDIIDKALAEVEHRNIFNIIFIYHLT